jgi:hypothetical protein
MATPEATAGAASGVNPLPFDISNKIADGRFGTTVYNNKWTFYMKLGELLMVEMLLLRKFFVASLE